MAAQRRTVHVPVMLHEVLEQMEFAPNLVIVDGTVGAGGHSSQMMKRMPSTCRLIGLDRDATMLARAQQVVDGDNTALERANYIDIKSVLESMELDHADRVLVDLGLSSDQLSDRDRGFGFDSTGQLDMRFHSEEGETAADLLASRSAAELEAIFRDYGEEKQAARIAGAIVSGRRSQPIKTVAQLVELITNITGPSRSGQSHPATRVFQALRIAVNEELNHLETFLTDVLPRTLRSGGRALVITFHSLEDRLVKQAFRKVTTWDNLTRKPITATPSEVRLNPRSRSAKLRVAMRK